MQALPPPPGRARAPSPGRRGRGPPSPLPARREVRPVWLPAPWRRIGPGLPFGAFVSIRRLAVFVEMVRIDLLDLISPIGQDADVKVDHELRELGAIDERHLRVDLLNVGNRLRGEGSGGDENPLSRAPSVERTDKLLDFRSTHGASPSLGLQVKPVSRTGQPILPAIDSIAAHCDGYGSLTSKTMRTARSWILGANCGDFLMVASFSIEGASSKSGAVQG